MNQQILKASEYAAMAHTGQVRKFTGEPYIQHCYNVRDLVASVIDNQDAICAAVLHDTIEDTEICYQDIVDNFGDSVAGMVASLTTVDGRCSVAYNLMLKGIDADVQTVKLADILDNLSGAWDAEPEFLERWIPKKAAQLRVLTRGSHSLRVRAMAALGDAATALASKQEQLGIDLELEEMGL